MRSQVTNRINNYIEKVKGKFQVIRTRIKTKYSFIKMLEFIALMVTILGVGIIGIIEPLQEYIEPLRVYNSEQRLQKIRVGCSEEYARSVLGVPQKIVSDTYRTKEGRSVGFTKSDYFTDDYILSIFTSKSEVVGYGLICRSKNFKPSIPFSDSQPIMTKSLFSYQPDEYGNTEFMKFFMNSRIDGGPFVLHFSSYGILTSELITGYGVSLLGYMDENQEDKVHDYINYLIKLNQDSGGEEGFISSNVIHENSKEINKFRSEIKPNAVFVLKEDWRDMDEDSVWEEKESNMMTNSELFICDYFNTEFLLDGITYKIMCK